MSTGFSKILVCYLILFIKPPLRMFPLEIYEFLKKYILKNAGKQLLLLLKSDFHFPKKLFYLLQ